MRTHVEPQAGGDGVAQHTEVTVIDGAEDEQGIRDRIERLLSARWHEMMGTEDELAW